MMMKRPKAYIKNLDVIVDVQIINFDDEVVEVYFNKDRDFVEYNFDEVIFLENTGVSDRYKDEIYIGDIITFNNKNYRIVKQNNGSYVAVGKHSIICDIEISRGLYEKIGNIYTNAELVEV